eukprot:Lithocolla_globosa_v1_NODE_199_length_5224_cov_8.409618.p6 type:complete len:115 gc:universal NODE_199_length_5224_cov_8.409618:1993-2337(+)
MVSTRPFSPRCRVRLFLIRRSGFGRLRLRRTVSPVRLDRQRMPLLLGLSRFFASPQEFCGSRWRTQRYHLHLLEQFRLPSLSIVRFHPTSELSGKRSGCIYYRKTGRSSAVHCV